MRWKAGRKQVVAFHARDPNPDLTWTDRPPLTLFFFTAFLCKSGVSAHRYTQVNKYLLITDSRFPKFMVGTEALIEGWRK